jgi:hypothetical protein
MSEDLTIWLMGAEAATDGWRGLVTGPDDERYVSPAIFPNQIDAFRWACMEAVRQLGEFTAPLPQRQRRKKASTA